MKPEFDTEIDALLRGHARGGGGASTSGDDTTAARGFVRERSTGERSAASSAPLDASSAPLEAQSLHLDADELAAFAENALPAAARTRYAAHLADCDDCRRTATHLALAAGLTVTRDESDVIARERIVNVSWHERLAALVAPRAWRYAMPVVALLCVGVIALVVMRRVPRETMQLARNNEETRADRASSIPQEEHHAMTETATQQPAQTATQTGSDASVPASNPAAASNDSAARGAVSGGGQPSAQTGGAVTRTENDAVANNAPAVVAAQPQRVEDFSPPPPQPASSAPTPVATPMPTPIPVAPSLEATPVPPPVDEMLTATKDEPKAQKSGQVAEREQAQPKTRRAGVKRDSSEVTVPAARSANRTALNDDLIRESESSAAGASSNKEQRKSAPSERGAKDADAARDKSSNETRKIGGRKFRREDGVWLDTAYNSSQATVVVRRNSEQYRALVADEPEIARIANSLGGEVVVVWKGRAYRIKP